jgi:PAS domain S-box-containing protein
MKKIDNAQRETVVDQADRPLVFRKSDPNDERETLHQSNEKQHAFPEETQNEKDQSPKTGQSRGYFEVDLAGNLLFFNDTLCRVLECSSDELTGTNYRKHTDAGEAQKVFEVCNKVYRTGKPVRDIAWQVRSKHGTRKYVEGSFSLLRNENGEPQGFRGVARDVTQREQVENELRASESNFRHSLDDSPLGIRISTANNETTYVNQKLLDIYGYDSIDELKNTPLKNRYTQESYEEWLERTEARRRGEFGPAEYEVKIIRKDGDVRHMSVIRKEIYWDGQKQFQVVYQDITERKRVEQEKDQLQERLLHAQKMESVGLLAGGVAHDFNNMLSVIIGNSEIALGKIPEEHPLHFNLQEILKAAERSAELTRQLLTFARKQTITPKVLDLNEAVAGTLKMLQRMIGEDIHLTWRPNVKKMPINIDPSQLDQILANLCVNARDAIHGIGNIEIECGSVYFDKAFCSYHEEFVPGNYIALTVSDNGCGIPVELKHRIFEPFFTTKDPGKGTGLGLSTVYGIVKQNNGFVNVYSEPGHGTTFRIYLPRYMHNTEDVEEERLSPLPRGSETILFVEDEPAILRLGKTMLEEQGYRVLAAISPDEAVRWAKEYREFRGTIQLLVTDVVMPEMNGSDLSKKIGSLYPGINCLFISGHTADIIARRGILEKGVNFLQKPFSKRALLTKVRELLDKR